MRTAAERVCDLTAAPFCATRLADGPPAVFGLRAPAAAAALVDRAAPTRWNVDSARVERAATAPTHWCPYRSQQGSVP